jgi:hypothetical protein
MERLPAILDVRDDLRAANDAAERDVDDDVADALGRLDEYADRDRGDREGLLDDLDNELLRLEEQVSDEEATRRFQAARNRIRVFRGSLSGGGDGLAVVDTKLGKPDADGDRDVSDLRTEDVEVAATVVNEGEARDVTVTVTFYDAESEEIRSDATETFALDGNAQETVTVSTTVPEDANYYAAVVRATGR